MPTSGLSAALQPSLKSCSCLLGLPGHEELSMQVKDAEQKVARRLADALLLLSTPAHTGDAASGYTMHVSAKQAEKACRGVLTQLGHKAGSTPGRAS